MKTSNLHKNRLLYVTALLVAVIAACQSERVREDYQEHAYGMYLNEEMLPVPTRYIMLRDVPVPPGVNASALQWPDDKAQKQGLLRLDSVTKKLKPPAELVSHQPITPELRKAINEQEASSSSDSLIPEPSLQAQQLYMQARVAIREQRLFDAMRQLQAVARLTPLSPEIYEMLGDVAAGSGNLIAAMPYYRQAVALDDQAVHSLFVLGRFALDQRRNEDAAWFFVRVLDLLKTTEHGHDIHRGILTPLTNFYLAQSLQRQGYTHAALEAYGQYVQPRRDTMQMSPRYREELMYLDLRRPILFITIGDLYNQLNAPQTAREAYALAAEGAPELSEEVVPRQLYTLLRMDRVDEAVSLLLDQLMQQDMPQETYAWVQYVASDKKAAQVLNDKVQTIYASSDPPESLTLALVQILPREQARIRMQEHLASQPSHVRIYDAMLELLLEDDDATQADHAQAVLFAAQMMGETPELADRYATALMQLWPEDQSLAEISQQVMQSDGNLSPATQGSLLTLEGLAWVHEGNMDQAMEVLEQAVNANPDDRVARVQLAKVLIVLGFSDQALSVLEPLSSWVSQDVTIIRATALAYKGRHREALSQIDRLVRLDGATSRVLKLKADIQYDMGDVEGAERTLLQAIEQHPMDESIYIGLMNLYSPPDGSSSQLADVNTRRAQLTERIFQNIPQSRTAQMIRAMRLASQRRIPEAEQILVSLWQNDPKDVQVLVELIRLYMQTNRMPQAVATMDDALEKMPDEFALFPLAVAVYEQAEDEERLFPVAKRLLMLEEPSQERSLNLARLYLRVEKYEQAVEVLDEILEQPRIEFPQDTVGLLIYALVSSDQIDLAVERLDALPDATFDSIRPILGYQLARLVGDQGDAKRCREIMLHYLNAYPDNVMLNNDLAYEWAVQDKHLERALGMAKKAVAAEPNQAAYVDTLGWVYYKLGRFEDAAETLGRASSLEGGTHPVILDHLGDALYRLGKVDEAKVHWREAIRQIPQYKTLYNDPEVDGLAERLPLKIEAAEQGEHPNIAEVPERPATDE